MDEFLTEDLFSFALVFYVDEVEAKEKFKKKVYKKIGLENHVKQYSVLPNGDKDGLYVYNMDYYVTTANYKDGKKHGRSREWAVADKLASLQFESVHDEGELLKWIRWENKVKTTEVSFQKGENMGICIERNLEGDITAERKIPRRNHESELIHLE